MIDLANPARPRLLQTVRAGANAAGLSINKAGTLVLVAARNDAAIFVFALKNKRLTPAGRVDLDKGSEPTDVVFTPDGRKAYVTTWSGAKVVELSVDGTRVAWTKRDIATGLNPYGAVITPDGNWLISTNVGGALMGTDRTGTLTMIDLKTPPAGAIHAGGPHARACDAVARRQICAGGAGQWRAIRQNPSRL